MNHARTAPGLPSRLGVAIITILATGLMVPSASAAPDPDSPRAEVRIDVGGLDPAGIIIPTDQPATEYRFALTLPTGAHIEQAPAAEGQSAGAIIVLAADGGFVGAFDDPVLQDAAGNLLPTTYRVEGSTLIQVVDVSTAAAFPVVLDPIYSGAQPTFGPPDPFIDDGQFSLRAEPYLIPVPSHYVYNPALGALHDYCTASPDEFPSPVGANADFRGPCARHDLCYGSPGSDHLWCDNQLYDHMINNCAYYYRSILDPNRGACFNTAAIYWAAVVAA